MPKSSTAQALALVPGTDIIPDGWCDLVVVPWLAKATNASDLKKAAAQLVGLEAAYRTLNADTLELVKARRHLEVRWGELLGPAKHTQGTRSDLSHASEESLAKDERHRFRQLAANRDEVHALLAQATDVEDLSRAAILRSVGGVHVGHNSGEIEWFTPAEYVKAAAVVMGGIDLDPASSPAANEVVGAKRFFTEADDGLEQMWRGRVWMNPPYSSALIGRFCEKLAADHLSGSVTQAVALTNNATETSWFAALASAAGALCFPRGRISFWYPDRPSVTPLQGQCFTYMGANVDAFRAEFTAFGTVWTP